MWSASSLFIALSMTDAELLRSEALQRLWYLVERITDEDAHADIIIWLDARSDDEEGFLWLCGQLGMRPSVLERTIRELIAAPYRRRSILQERLRRMRIRMAR